MHPHFYVKYVEFERLIGLPAPINVIKILRTRFSLVTNLDSELNLRLRRCARNAGRLPRRAVICMMWYHDMISIDALCVRVRVRARAAGWRHDAPEFWREIRMCSPWSDGRKLQSSRYDILLAVEPVCVDIDLCSSALTWHVCQGYVRLFSRTIF